MNNLQRNYENNPIYDSIKKNKIFKNNLTKETKNLHTKNYKKLLKEIEDKHKREDVPMFINRKT